MEDRKQKLRSHALVFEGQTVNIGEIVCIWNGDNTRREDGLRCHKPLLFVVGLNPLYEGLELLPISFDAAKALNPEAYAKAAAWLAHKEDQRL